MNTMTRLNFCTKIFFLFTFTLIINSCTTSPTGSYLSTKYASQPYISGEEENNINYEGIERNPLIIIPGFLGSSLIDAKTRENIWGTFKASESIKISDKQMRSLTYPMNISTPIRKLKDNIIADKLLENIKIKILGTEFKQDVYKDMIDILIKGGYVPENRPLPKNKHYASMFLFAYDWRKDLPENAARLGEFIKEKKKYIQKQYEKNYEIKNYNVKFDIVAHSMGGLVSRYFLRYGNQDLPKNGSMPKLNWSGSNYIDRLILIGTPNSGYMDAFIELLNGGNIPPYPAAALGTFPSYYQMLPTPNTKSIFYTDDPTGKPIDIFDPNIWNKNKWGLANPDVDKTLKIILPNIKSKNERKTIALDHLSKCLKRAKQFTQAMSIKSTPPKNVKLYLVFGYGVKTTRRVLIDRETGKIKKISYASGDSKVLALSALSDRRLGNNSHFLDSSIKWSGIFVIRAAHLAITKDPSFADNILFMLTMEKT
ncbi:MAG: hypothetical protein GY756_28265 [bacterium]|nr:hypothetical protein [bacterium]